MAKTFGFGVCLLGFFLSMLPAMAQFGDETIVERVDIRGNRRIPEDTIRANIVQIRPGEPYDESKVEFDLRSLYRTNYFENLEVQEKDGDIGKVITFVVREKPLIRSIEYVGNKSFTESDILDAFKEKKLGLTVDSQYDPVKVKMAERLLHDLMVQSGKPLGSVHSEVEPFPPYSVRVRFVVDEGTNVRIGKIRFTGNKVFDDSKLRAALQMSKERSVFTMFKGLDKYHREKLEYDIEMNLKAFYQQHGYMQVQFGQPVTRIFEGPRGVLPFLRKTKEQFFVEIPIDAGDQYRLGKLELKECGVLSCEALQRAFGMKEGDILNFKAVKDTLEQFKKLYGEVGYINFSYLPEHHADPKTKVYDLTLTMQPDKQFFVRRINFLGNTKTRDKVIRREFILEEGKVFSSIALDNSVLRLNQLGYFEQVEEKDYEVKPDEKTSMVDVDIKLKEKSQQSIGFSGGISGISGSFIGLNYSTNNFLGRGESLDVNIMGGTRQTNYSVTFTEPYLFDTRWNMGLQIYNQRYRYDTYSTFGLTDYNGEASELFTQKTTGGTLTISRRLPRSLWTVGTSYTYQKIGVSNIATGFETFALGQFIGYTSGDSSDALEGITRSEITPMVSYNSTNAYFNATAGKSLNVSAAIAGGILGGDFNMVRPALEYRHFIADRWLSHGRNVFAFNLQLQYTQAFGNSVVPFFDRFFIGGENTIRGFDIRSISPLAVTRTRQFDGTSSGNCVIDTDTGLCQTLESSPFAVGGDAVGILNFEYRIPIAGPLSMSGFYDIGITRAMRKSSLGNFGASEVSIIGDTNNKLRSSTGVELQFVLPVVSAPFRLIFAYNPQRLSGSVTTPGGTTYTINEPSKDVKFTVGRSF